MTPQQRLPQPAVRGMRQRFHQTPTAAVIPAFPGIYRVVCLPLTMAYVGQSWDLTRRCLEHQVLLRDRRHPNPRLQGAFNRFGPAAFTFEVLELLHGLTGPDALSPAEQRWMDAHPRTQLFNVRPAGSDAYIVGQRLFGENRPLGRGPVSPHDTSKKSWKYRLDHDEEP